MYHISDDARAKKSAERIFHGLDACLKENPLSKVRVCDVYQKAGVSRATFYRLFDGINDVFAYACDKIRANIIVAAQKQIFPDQRELVAYCIKQWLTHETLMKALVDNGMFNIFYDSHMRNADILKQLYAFPPEEDYPYDYFASILTSLTYAVLSIYFRHGGSEPIVKVYRSICRCTEIVSDTLVEI